MKKQLTIFALVIALGGVGIVFAAYPAAACQNDDPDQPTGPYSDCIIDNGGW